MYRKTTAIHYATHPTEYVAVPPYFVQQTILESRNAWDEQFRELVRFKSKHGHCQVPRRIGKLGKWVDTQRTAYQVMKQGNASPLTTTMMQQLENVNFDWEFKSDFDTTLLPLKRPKQQNRPHAEFGLPAQRSQLDGKIQISSDHKRKTWMTRFKQLQKYNVKNGHSSVSDNSPLAGWLKTQKWQYKLLKLGRKSTMTPKRFSMLASLGIFKDASSEEEQEITENRFYSAFIDDDLSEDETLAAWRQRFQVSR